MSQSGFLPPVEDVSPDSAVSVCSPNGEAYIIQEVFTREIVVLDGSLQEVVVYQFLK